MMDDYSRALSTGYLRCQFWEGKSELFVEEDQTRLVFFTFSSGVFRLVDTRSGEVHIDRVSIPSLSLSD